MLSICTMKYILTLTLILISSTDSFAKVEVCHRPAQIIKGMVNHYWLKTETKEAGMGSDEVGDVKIGDKFEMPYATKVFIVDHSNQTALICKERSDVDEDCVNASLDVGRYLGHFSLTNNCQTFVSRVIDKCLMYQEEIKDSANEETKD